MFKTPIICTTHFKPISNLTSEGPSFGNIRDLINTVLKLGCSYKT